jgi:hypothetical protein
MASHHPSACRHTAAPADDKSNAPAATDGQTGNGSASKASATELPSRVETRHSIRTGNGPLAYRAIAETIDLVAVLAGRGSSRRLIELARVEGLGPEGDYRIAPHQRIPGETTTTKGAQS